MSQKIPLKSLGLRCHISFDLWVVDGTGGGFSTGRTLYLVRFKPGSSVARLGFISFCLTWLQKCINFKSVLAAHIQRPSSSDHRDGFSHSFARLCAGSLALWSALLLFDTHGPVLPRCRFLMLYSLVLCPHKVLNSHSVQLRE